MGNLIQIVKGVVNAKIVNDDPRAKTIVQQILSYKVAGAEHTPNFEKSKWDGTSNFLDWNSGKFPAGFVRRARLALEKHGYQVQVQMSPLPAPLGPENPRVSKHPHDPRYEYQMETVRRLLKHGQMIAQVATGGGKSQIANLATARIKRKTLFITTRGALMYQMRDHFMEAMRQRFIAGEKDVVELIKKVGVIGDGVWEPGRSITVAMVQTLARRLTTGTAAERAETIAFLASHEFVILEEAHEVSGTEFYDVMRYCTKAAYRLALTATPFMRDDEEANMRLMACAGGIGIQVTEKELIDKGILATPYFVTLPTRYEADQVALKSLDATSKKAAAMAALGKHAKTSHQLGWSSDYQRAVKLGIVHNKWRNQQIVNSALQGKKYGLPVIALVMHKRHGNLLYWSMKEAGLNVAYIQGEDGQEARTEALGKLKTGELDVVIGTTIIDVGVDVPAASMLILCGGGKAEVTLRQRVGRVLREKRNVANVAVIVDFEDKVNKHLYGHYMERAMIIDGTPGFRERRLQLGQQFEYSKFFQAIC